MRHRHICTLSFHRHFNYGKSATRTRDSVTIISLTRASDWSLALVRASDWLFSRHPWLRYHWHQDRSHPGTELLHWLVFTINISTSPPSLSSAAIPIPHQRRQLHRVLGWGWHHNWAHNPPGSVHAAVIMEISMKCTGKRDFIWLLFAFYFAEIYKLFILVTGLVSSGGCCLSQRCALKVDMIKIDNFDILFPVRPRRLSTRVDKSKQELGTSGIGRAGAFWQPLPSFCEWKHFANYR